MSLWPCSSPLSNIAVGSACAATASIPTAASFWSPSSRSAFRAFGVRGPRRGPFDFPKSVEVYLVGSNEQPDPLSSTAVHWDSRAAAAALEAALQRVREGAAASSLCLLLTTVTED